MRCPFLREAQVKFCGSSVFRKMILRPPRQDSNERCSLPEYVDCPAAKQYREERPVLDHCPFLHESLVQYCAAGSVTKYIPYTESLVSRCGTDSHRYCEQYLSMAGAGMESAGVSPSRAGGHPQNAGEEVVDGMRVPHWLWYSSNHMWLHVSADGILHVGIDELLAKILGRVDDLIFVTLNGVYQPTVVFCTSGAGVRLAFPNRILITKTNSHLRAHPSKIVQEPYTLGWLFEGVTSKESGPRDRRLITSGLIAGREAGGWMHRERQRIAQLKDNFPVHQDRRPASTLRGQQNAGYSETMNREEFVAFFDEVVSPRANGRELL